MPEKGAISLIQAVVKKMGREMIPIDSVHFWKAAQVKYTTNTSGPMAVKKGSIHQESLRDVSRNDGFGFSILKLFCMGIVYRLLKCFKAKKT